MAQSRKAIKDYSAVYLDGLRLDTNSAGNLTLGGQEIGGGGGNIGEHLSVQTATVGNLTVPVIEGASSFINDNGLASFTNLYVDNTATIGSLAIGTVEGTSASIDQGGRINCNSLTFTTMFPSMSSGTQDTSITTPISSSNQFGSVLTVSTNLAAQSSVSIPVNNAYVYQNMSKIITNIVSYNGTGMPSVYVSNVVSSEFTIKLQNNSTTEPLNGQVEIGYIILGID